ncbi:MAG: hypothetical protein KAR54_00170, partial [Candidatus Pacebacteria bacterium]|nr:hypothetical protein [Candidatus Paceibacterota bacterium]
MEELDKNQNKQTQIEKMKKTLFFDPKKVIKKEIPKLKERKYKVKTDWTQRQRSLGVSKISKKKISFFTKLLIFSIAFFFISFGIAFFVFYGGVNIISTENVDISVTGPSSIGGGEELSFQITVQNNNSVDLELADLIIKYPKGTLSAIDKNTELVQVREALDTISSGSSMTKLFKSTLFGGEGDKKEILITIEYRAKGSNAIFFKERKYEVIIDSSPVVFNVDIPKEVMVGQEFELSIDISSNSNKIVKDFLFVVDYPFGFDFKSSDIKPSYSDNVWDIGDIQPNSTRILKIKGVIEGQDKEERVFKFYGGAKDLKKGNEIKAKLVSIDEPVLIKKTLIGVELVLNGDYALEYTAPSGKSIRVDILWSNNLATKLIDGRVELKLNGIVLDEESISSETGFYSSIDNTITWDKSDNPQLTVLNPGDDGNLSFSFSIHPLSFISNSGIKNPEIDLDLTVIANQLSDINSVETVETTLSKKIKISTDLLLTGRSLYSIGSFENIGPIPPEIEKETNYTIVWTVVNTSNDISNAKVVASLPSYVKWAGNISPRLENISFNPIGGEITWDVGDIRAGDGVSTIAKEVSFQVTLTPSLSQIGTAPILVDNISLEGVDDFTNKLINYS